MTAAEKEPANPRCGICGKRLDVDEPLARDCGGHCWGCVSAIEAEMIDVEVGTYRADPAGEMKRYQGGG